MGDGGDGFPLRRAGGGHEGARGYKEHILQPAAAHFRQNMGAKQPKRAKKGVSTALLLSIGCILVLMVPVLIFAPGIIGFLVPEPEVVKTGTMFLRTLTPFYVLFAFNQVYACALRGRGNSVAPMIIMLTSFVGFRQLYLFIMSQVCYEIVPIAMAYPAGWLLCSLLTGIVYHVSTRDN